jgi:hypothetical protein
VRPEGARRLLQREMSSVNCLGLCLGTVPQVLSSIEAGRPRTVATDAAGEHDSDSTWDSSMNVTSPAARGPCVGSATHSDSTGLIHLEFQTAQAVPPDSIDSAPALGRRVDEKDLCGCQERRRSKSSRSGW